MATCTFYESRLVDEPRLHAFLKAKGLVPSSRKWDEVRQRIYRRFYKELS